MGEREGSTLKQQKGFFFFLAICKKVSLLRRKVPSFSSFYDCITKPLKTGVPRKNADTALNTVSKKERKGCCNAYNLFSFIIASKEAACCLPLGIRQCLRHVSSQSFYQVCGKSLMQTLF